MAEMMVYMMSKTGVSELNLNGENYQPVAAPDGLGAVFSVPLRLRAVLEGQGLVEVTDVNGTVGRS